MVMSLPGARYVLHSGKGISGTGFIACDTCYSVSDSIFSPICLKDNSVSILLHPVSIILAIFRQHSKAVRFGERSKLRC